MFFLSIWFFTMKFIKKVFHNYRFVDSQHTCCNTIRDEKGICCLSGYLDECYVCDGDGITCATNLTLFVNFDSNLTITYEVEEKWKYLIFILLTNVSHFFD